MSQITTQSLSRHKMLLSQFHNCHEMPQSVFSPQNAMSVNRQTKGMIAKHKSFLNVNSLVKYLSSQTKCSELLAKQRACCWCTATVTTTPKSHGCFVLGQKQCRIAWSKKQIDMRRNTVHPPPQDGMLHWLRCSSNSASQWGFCTYCAEIIINRQPRRGAGLHTKMSLWQWPGTDSIHANTQPNPTSDKCIKIRWFIWQEPSNDGQHLMSTRRQPWSGAGLDGGGSTCSWQATPLHNFI